MSWNWLVVIRFSFFLVSCLCAAIGSAQDKDFSFFENRIRPVLIEHCYECHSATSKPVRAGLRVDTRDGLRRGGETGPAVAPGDVENSLILDALQHESFEMPPKGKLPKRIIDDFQRWIVDGALDPRKDASNSVARIRRADASFWSYQPVREPQPPVVKDAEWNRHAIDRFIRHRLEAAGLPVAKMADRATLLRRLTFDLTGLPPTRAQRERFLQGSDEASYLAFVDELLDSPQFGERWARHWLDVARYAESTGGGRTKIFDAAWQYRDYVIRSLNTDKSFARFAQEQIAGDLLEHPDLRSRRDGLIATAFLVLGPINYELQDKELLRMEVIDEQLDVMGRAFLGMTIGCARCHDHKFDPFSTAEYYSLAGILHSTRSLTPGNVSGFVMRPLPVSDGEQAKIDAAQKVGDELREQLKSIDAELGKLSGKVQQVGRVKKSDFPGIVLDTEDAQQIGEWMSSVSVAGFVGDSYIHDKHEQLGQKQVVYSAIIQTAGEYELRVSYTASTNRASNAQIVINAGGAKLVKKINQRKRPPIDGRWLAMGRFQLKAGETAETVIRNEGADGVVIADCVQWLPTDPQLKASAKSPAPKSQSAGSAKLETLKKQAIKKLRAEKKRLEADIKSAAAKAPSSPLVMSVDEQAKPGDLRICVRGNVHQPGEIAPRGFPTALGQVELPIAPSRSGRLELAQWLAHPQNPRTSRVIANRVWRHLMGAGIVRTPDDFGPMGNAPSHPELLDHLASDLMHNQWSLKKLIRKIVASRTYRSSSVAPPELRRVDPENRLFGWRRRRRLDAEALRDAMLSISGKIQHQLGGSTLRPNTKTEFGYSFDNVRYRRSIYLPVLRNALHDFLEAFDAANPNLVSGRRSVSTLPSQSLFLMNSPEIWDLSEHAADQLLAEELESEEARVDFAFVRFFGRPASSRERVLSLRYLEAEKMSKQQWTKFCQSLFASVDFRYVR